MSPSHEEISLTENPPVRQFEALLEELHATVKLLEGDDLTLEEAISSYERAVSIANQCSHLLDEAELRITQIDASSRSLRDDASIYRAGRFDAARLLLGDDEDELADLLDDDVE